MMDPIKPDPLQTVPSPESTPAPTLVAPVTPAAPSPTAPVVQSQQAQVVGAWFMLIIVLPFLVISILASIFISSLVSHATTLQKTGTKGTAVVTTSVESSGDKSGPSYLISYHLVGVPGYGTQTYSSLVPGIDGQNVTSGQHMAVIYNPSNPSDNSLQAALNNNTSSIAVIFPWLFPVIPLIAMVVVILNIRKATRRNRAISSLSA